MPKKNTNKLETLISQVEHSSLRLVFNICDAIREIVSKKERRSIDCRILHRYVDEDLEQSVTRINRVSIDDEHDDVILLCQDDNGESRASQIRPCDDDDFIDETYTVNLNAGPCFDTDEINMAMTVLNYLKLMYK